MAKRTDENVYAERDRMMDINTATFKELCQVPGIDRKRARDIVRLRESLGRLDSLEDLRAIRSFDDASLERIREHLAVKRPKG